MVIGRIAPAIGAFAAEVGVAIGGAAFGTDAPAPDAFGCAAAGMGAVEGAEGVENAGGALGGAWADKDWDADTMRDEVGCSPELAAIVWVRAPVLAATKSAD
jgi:hypothetical protein